MIDVVIAHAAWAAGRKAALGRLVACLPEGTHDNGLIGFHPQIVASQVKEHANVWAMRVWRTIQENDEWDVEEDSDGTTGPHADATLILNDDVLCHPDILAHVETLTKAYPGRVLSLHGNFPLMRTRANEGATAVSCYWPSGPAYVFPRGFAAGLLAWLETVPKGWWSGDTNEDGVLAAYLWTLQQPTITTIPALVKHDTSVPSTVVDSKGRSYDTHPNRTSWVPWIEEGIAGFPIPDWSEPPARIPYVPVPWMTDTQMAQLGRALRGILDGPAARMCDFCLRTVAGAKLFENASTKRSVCLGCSTVLGHAALAHHIGG